MAVAIGRLNPLGEVDARLLEFVGHGGHLITGFRNRDVRHCLYGERSKDAAVHRRQSGQVSRLLALLRPRIDPENHQNASVSGHNTRPGADHGDPGGAGRWGGETDRRGVNSERYTSLENALEIRVQRTRFFRLVVQSDPILRMGVTPVRSRREFQVGPSEAIHSDPRALDPLGQLADVDLILLGRVFLLRILLSVISGHPKGRSVVIRSSYLPKSSPMLSAPAQPCGRGRLARFSLPQRLAVWWVALPWPILPVPAVLLALCRVVAF